MSPDSVELLLLAVRDLPAADRARALDASCQDRPQLRQEVERRLATGGSAAGGSAAGNGAGENSSSDNAAEAFPRTAIFEDPSLASTDSLLPGSMLGRYKLLEEIGEGGFGVVFVAQQREPVKRRVAIKVIKLGMDTRQVIARFEAERQTLAMMDHPHIARVLDAGATDRGRPYFVMELVRGEPITAYCQKARTSIKDRIRLFLQVCRAVHHAHQKGIIHRDLKPTNVLVTVTDDEPNVKVIDFGIAKATNAELTERTLVTEFQQLIGTPVYMSPEQIERSGIDIDTRADIYSMGILLYELLVESLPFDPDRLQSASWSELQRIICEEEPPRMSQRIESRSPTGRWTAVELVRWRNQLRGDLDWIVAKATEKDRRHRYGTINEVCDDLERYLRNEPVSATPPTTRYRLRKFVRRHRVSLAVGGTMVAALLVALAVTASFLVWALKERNRAQAATARAEEEANRAEQFLNLAGTTFLGIEEIEQANLSWGAEILRIGESLPEVDPVRIRRECQYVTWLITQAVVHKQPELLRKSVVDIEELRERAKQVLGLDNPHFLNLAEAHARSAMVLENKDPAEIAGLLGDVVESYGSVRGKDENYQQFVVERALAIIGSQAGRSVPTAEAVRVLTETAAHLGITLDSGNLSSRRVVDTLQQQLEEWKDISPGWYQSLLGPTVVPAQPPLPTSDDATTQSDDESS